MLAAAVLGAAVAVAVLVVSGVVGENRVVERTVGIPQDDGSGESRLAAVSAASPAVVRVVPQPGVPGGSAVVVAGDGTAVTALTVVGEAATVRLAAGGAAARAEVLGTVPQLGIAVVRPERPVGEAASLGGLEQPLPPGRPVMTVVNATGLEPQVGAGVVSAVRRETSTPADAVPEDAILTDAGGSGALGAALVGERGDILGVMIRPGAALPMNIAAAAARIVADGGTVRVAYLGAIARDAADDPPDGVTEGAVVVTVRAGSPADGVLEPGDTVVGVGSRQVRDAPGLADAVSGATPGDVVRIAVVRDGERADLEARLAERPTSLPAPRR
ncbi:MAG: S1C family serine protease [Thermoleophilia bacterium]